jgi:zinc/manganese transport system substrate-binding protein
MPATGYCLLAAAAALVISPSIPSAAAAEQLKVVASFSILGDLVAEVGGDNVELVTLVGPNGDAHVYEPSPADARNTANAALVVVNGLGFEGWLGRLVEASGFAGTVVVASKGIDPIETGEDDEEHAAEGDHEAGEEQAGEHHHGPADPHAWQSVQNVMSYVENIADALCEADAANCEDFRTNADRYTAELQALDAEMKAGFEIIPEERRKVITTHDAFGYFAEAYGVEFLAPQGVSTDSEASAADVAELIRQIREEAVTALFVENVSDPRLIEQIARETGVTPGGELFSDALSGPEGPASTYIDMMRHNAGILQAGMQGS